MPDCFTAVKLWHNHLPLFLSMIKGFHNAPHSVSTVPTTVFCILQPEMDSGKHKQSKQANKTYFYPLAFFFHSNINATFIQNKQTNINNIVTNG